MKKQNDIIYLIALQFAIILLATWLMTTAFVSRGFIFAIAAMAALSIFLLYKYYYKMVAKQQNMDRAKDEFISLVSHQLRTPLTATRLFTEMLADGQAGKLSAQQQDYVDKIRLSTERTIALVANILSISRIELGRIKVEPVPMDLAALVRATIDELQPLAGKKDVKIIFNAPQLEPMAIDAAFYSQILHNLLSNAIRYNKKGGEVRITLTQDDTGCVLGVSDDGIGIPKVAQSHIFERFYRSANAERTEVDGTGLGLYLVKIIMQALGGKVWFESIEGKGSTFYVSLPPDGMKAKDGLRKLE